MAFSDGFAHQMDDANNDVAAIERTLDYLGLDDNIPESRLPFSISAGMVANSPEKDARLLFPFGSPAADLELPPSPLKAFNNRPKSSLSLFSETLNNVAEEDKWGEMVI